METERVRRLSIPVEEETLQLLDEVADYYALSRPRLVEKFLREGVQTARLDHAAERYARREVTLERAAELAGVSIYEMMAHLWERDIPVQRRASDIRADVAAMLIRSGRSDIAEYLAERTFLDSFAKVIEDFALTRAIKEGESTEIVKRET